MIVKKISCGMAEVQLLPEQSRVIAKALREAWPDAQDEAQVDALAAAFELLGVVAEMQLETVSPPDVVFGDVFGGEVCKDETETG